MPIVTVSSPVSGVTVLLEAAVNTLKYLGYSGVDKETIFVDPEYGKLFIGLLEQKKQYARRADVTADCDILIAKVQNLKLEI